MKLTEGAKGAGCPFPEACQFREITPQASRLPVLGVSTARAGGRAKTQAFFRGTAIWANSRATGSLSLWSNALIPLIKIQKWQFSGNLSKSQNVQSGKHHWTVSSRDCPFLTGPLFVSHLLPRLLSPSPGLTLIQPKEESTPLLHEETVEWSSASSSPGQSSGSGRQECSPKPLAILERKKHLCKRRSSFFHTPPLPHLQLHSNSSHPITAKAGSSWRSKGSGRNRVLNRAVMVSEGKQSSRGRWV